MFNFLVVTFGKRQKFIRFVNFDLSLNNYFDTDKQKYKFLLSENN